MASRYYASRCPNCEHISGRIWKDGYPSPFRPYLNRKDRGARIKCYSCEKRYSPKDGYIRGTLTEAPATILKYVAQASAGKATGWAKAVDL